MTTGNKSGYAGGSVPLEGESEIRQASSGIDVLTISLNSGAGSTTAGKAFVVKGSAKQTLFSVDAGGNMAAAGGTLEIGAGGALTLGSSASFAAPVWATVVIPTTTNGSSALDYTVLPANAGKLHIVPLSCAAGGKVVLPACSAVSVGTQFAFYMNGAANASGIKITSSASSSDTIRLWVAGVLDPDVTIQVVSTGLQLGAAVTLVAVTSKIWAAFPLGTQGSSAAPAVWISSGAVA